MGRRCPCPLRAGLTAGVAGGQRPPVTGRQAGLNADVCALVSAPERPRAGRGRTTMSDVVELGIDTFGDTTLREDGTFVPLPQVIRDVVEEGVLADEVARVNAASLDGEFARVITTAQAVRG